MKQSSGVGFLIGKWCYDFYVDVSLHWFPLSCFIYLKAQIKGKELKTKNFLWERRRKTEGKKKGKGKQLERKVRQSLITYDGDAANYSSREVKNSQSIHDRSVVTMVCLSTRSRRCFTKRLWPTTTPRDSSVRPWWPHKCSDAATTASSWPHKCSTSLWRS